MNWATRLLPFCLGCFLIHAQPLKAALQWQTSSQVVNTDISEERVEVTFNFTNTGSTPVEFLKIDTGCNCASAQAEPNKLQPGEQGLLRVIALTKGLPGTQTRNLTIETSDAPGAPARLTLLLNVANLVWAKPKLLLWRSDELGLAKTVSVETNPDFSIELGSLECDSPAWTAEWGQEEAGKPSRTIRIQPAADGKPDQAVLKIRYKAKGRELQSQVYLALR